MLVNAPDLQFWKTTKSCVSFSPFVNILQGNVQVTTQNPNLFSLCWSSEAPPKIKFFNWLLLHRSIPFEGIFIKAWHYS